MKENKIEELQERLEELHRIQKARLACGADDLDIREEISEVEDEIKELEYDINEENNNGNDTNVGSIENSIEEDIILLKDFTEGNFKRDKLENYKGSYKMGYFYYKNIQQAIEHILSDYKRVLKENEKLKKDYYNVINKIENKIDRFDYKFEKAKRQNNKDKSDCYWNLIINFKELLESEE